MGIPAIDRLGEGLDAAWRARDYEASCFPSLSAEHVAVAGLHRAAPPAEILRWALENPLPEQFDQLSKFGQPPLTVFRAGRFIIDALFWVDGTTNIHDHSFSGAFQVLAGSSIETTFSFMPSRSIDGHLVFGELRLDDAALLRAGDVRPIVAGPRYIHSLFHLDRPSVTLLVRALHEPVRPIPLSYQPCGIGWNPFLRDESLDRVVEIVEMLVRTQDPSFESVVGDLIARSNLYTVYRIVRQVVDIQDQRRLDSLLGRVRDRAAAERFADWLTEERQLRFLRRSRGLVHDSALRFFLAVLFNCHRGEHSFKLVSSYLGAGVDAAAQIASWLARLSKVTMRLQAGGAPWEPNVLNLPDFEDGFEDALVAALGKRERAFSPAERAFLERLRALPHLAPLFAE